MSQVNISVDTKSNKSTITIDGQKLDDVNYVTLYRNQGSDDGQYNDLSIETSVYDKENDVYKTTRFMSSGLSEARLALSTQEVDTTTIPGMIGVAVTDCQEDLTKFLSKNSRFS